MLNCDNRECLNFIQEKCYEDNSFCKALNVEDPMDLWRNKNANCEYFTQSKTCRECKHGVLSFYCNEEYDYEEDYKCRIDKNVYTQYVYMWQQDDDYQCKCDHFEHLEE